MYRRHYAKKCKACKLYILSMCEWLRVGSLERSQVRRGDLSFSRSGSLAAYVCEFDVPDAFECSFAQLIL